MMQETQIARPTTGEWTGPLMTGEWTGPLMTGESLAALLALAGAKRLGVRELMARTRLNPSGFMALLSWLKREYLVDVVSSLEGDEVRERLELTDRGESVLISQLEKMCELPEFR